MRVNGINSERFPLKANLRPSMLREAESPSKLAPRDEVSLSWRANDVEGDKGILWSDDERLRIERRIGREVAKRVESKYGLCRDPELNERAERILNRLLPYFKRRREIRPTIKVLDTNMINAFSVPGGYIYVTKGIMRLMSDEEMMFVIGHELGHLDREHAMERLERVLAVQAILSLLLGGGLASHLLVIIYNMLVESAFSRDNEFEADNEGLRYLVQAGGDPRASITAMEKLSRLEKEEPNLIERLLRDHPPTEERIRKLRSWIRVYEQTGEIPHES